MGTIADIRRNLERAQVDSITSIARPSATGLVLVCCDALALVVSGWLGVFLWGALHASVSTEFYLGLWPVFAVFLLVFAVLGLYPGAGLNPVEELRATVLGTTGGYLIFAASIYLSKGVGIHSRGVFLSSWLCSVFFVPLSRAFVRHLLARKAWWGVPVLVLGAGRSASMVVARLLSQPALGLKPVACLDDDEKKHGNCAGIPVAGPLSITLEISRALRIRHAVVAMPGLKRQQLITVLERMSSVFPHVIVIPDLFGMASLWVSARDLGGVLGLEVRQNLLVPVNRVLKRTIDLVLATTLGLAALPVVAAAVFWIRRVSPGPTFYIQEREGENGSTIRVRKLRTMHRNADALLEEHLSTNPQARREWERYFKLKRDPRILPGIGPILRRTSLDELPQLWNVLRGDMSLVGPRPFPYYHLEKFERRFRTLRNRVSPGLTGLWQVSARSDGDLAVQEALDTYYIRNWSLWLDIHILARTARAVLFRQGAY